MRCVITPSCYLVELQHVEQVKELAVLLAVLQLGVVLLQAVECEFGLVVHEYFHGLHRRRQRVSLFSTGAVIHEQFSRCVGHLHLA